MNLLMCCGEKSVRLSEPKTAETFASVSHNETAQNKEGNKKRGSNTWQKLKKWSVKHLFWNKHKKSKASHISVSAEIEIKPVSECTPVQKDLKNVCAADIKIEPSTNTWEDIKIDPNTNTWEESPAIRMEKEENWSTSNSSNSPVNIGSSNELNITNIHWIAGREEKLCEDNIETLVNATESTSCFLIRENGEGEISLDEELGKGAFGSVRKGKWSVRKNNGNVMTKDVAIKIINYNKLEVNEVKALTRCRHPSIIELHFVVIHAGRAFLGLELASGGDLITYLEEEGPLLESHARILFGQIVDAIEHCHINGIAHMDIKPDNILMHDITTIKLTDFGLSLVQPDPAKIAAGGFKSNAFCGTLPYAAPEIFTSNVYDSRKCDVWSLGCLLFEMLTCEYPYSLTNIEATNNIPEDNRAGSNYLFHARRLYKRPKFPPGLSTSVRGLIITMLRFKAKYRTNISKIQHHNWFEESSNNVEPRVEESC